MSAAKPAICRTAVARAASRLEIEGAEHLMNMGTHASLNGSTLTPALSLKGRGGRSAALLLLLCAALAGCGYSHGGTFPKDVASIAVPIFENRTPYRDVEFDLTEALIKEIELRTPYKVVRSGDADTILAGVVTNVDQRVLSRRAVGGLAQEVEVSLVINFEWKHQRTGDSLRDRRGFVTVGRYVPARPVGEPFEVARHEAVQQLARDIVAVMRADW